MIAEPAKKKFIQIDEDVAKVLNDQLAYEGNNLRITGARLDPKLWIENSLFGLD
jgi:hypothetical protein